MLFSVRITEGGIFHNALTTDSFVAACAHAESINSEIVDVLHHPANGDPAILLCQYTMGQLYGIGSHNEVIGHTFNAYSTEPIHRIIYVNDTSKPAPAPTPVPLLVHKSTGLPVAIGDTVTSFRGEHAIVTGWRAPTSPASSGFISIREGDEDFTQEYYASVYGCEWINRTDRNG